MNSKSLHVSLTPQLFWESVNILLEKPHVINKRLWGSRVCDRFMCKRNFSAWELPATWCKLKEAITVKNIEAQTAELMNKLNVVQYSNHLKSGADELEFILIELLPKRYTDRQAYHLVCLQKDRTTVKFYDVTPESFNQNLSPNFSYVLQLENNVMTLIADCDENSKSYLWLVNTLLPQFIKWGTESRDKSNVNLCSESLSLVVKDEYYEKYNYLKWKYGKQMVKIWPECTDPSKFVYEDVAIAAYLLLLWGAQRKDSSRTSFVDLGCGNGLLVYILTEEGHVGVGLDIRKRNIWDMYPTATKLEEKTIVPSDVSLFPDTDWIIGNHSDELTPWIPVIAARSSYKCNFFLLPCCAYNFDGTKYQRKNSSKSQYTEYLEHIKQLCEDCGFKVETDRLKIPSTKRICLIGRERDYSEDEQQEYVNRIQDMIKNDTQDLTQENVLWVNDFKAREQVERVRNCTQLDRNLIDSIVDTISKYLLEGCSVANAKWCIGKTIPIYELVQLIPEDRLKMLKSECGGLQTLLKNNHHIFKVQSGKVQLRYPKTVEEVNKNSISKKKHNPVKIKLQQKPCWFYTNHPQGCPLDETNCSYSHAKVQ